MSNPLERLFEQGHPRPGFLVESTANWRGYVAHWEIEDEALFLVGLGAQVFRPSEEHAAGQVRRDHLQKYSLEDLFPGCGGSVRASWFTGALRVPYGEIVKYVHAGYESRCERYVILDVDSGRLVRTMIISDAELQRQKADARLGKLARLLKRFPPLWAAYSAMASRRDKTQQVAPHEALDDRELIRRLENFLAELKAAMTTASTSARRGWW